MNSLLQNALVNAIDSSTGYTEKAITEQRDQLKNAISALNTGLSGATGAVNTGLFNANNAATSNVNRGLINSQILQAPYSSMGLGAADAYADSLGISRPTMGSGNLQNSIFQYQKLKPQIEALQGAAKEAGMNPFELGQFTQVAPTAPTLFNIPGFQAQVDPEAVNSVIRSKIKDSGFGTFYYDDPASNIQLKQGGAYDRLGANWDWDYGRLVSNNMLQDYYRNQLVQQQKAAYDQQYAGQIAQNKAMQEQYDTQLNAFNTAQNKYNTYSGLFNNMQTNMSGIDPNQLRNAISAGNSMFARGI